MSQKRYLWHCTKADFLKDILREGIKARHPEARPSKAIGVYLSEYRFNWMWNTTREGKFKGAALRIDVTGLSLVSDYHVDERDVCNNSKCIGRDFICESDIPPERIREIWVETEPQTFQSLNISKFRNNAKH